MNNKNYQKLSTMEDKNTPFGHSQGRDPDAPQKKPDDSGIDVDFDDESEAPSKSYRKRSFTENVKANNSTVNPQSVKGSNENKDHRLPSFAANGNQEVEMSVNKTAALDHTTIGLQVAS